MLLSNINGPFNGSIVAVVTFVLHTPRLMMRDVHRPVTLLPSLVNRLSISPAVLLGEMRMCLSLAVVS